MKVAYICHHTRANYELEWFKSLPVEEVTFITTDAQPPRNTKKIKYATVQYHEEGWQNRFFASTAFNVKYSGFEGALEGVDIVVVLEVFSSLSRQFVEYCKRINKPVVVLVYELIAGHPIYKIPNYRSNMKYCLKNADHFIAVSKAAESHLHKLGASKDKTSVVYPGVDRSVFQPDYTKRTDSSIIFVGKLEPHKGIDLLLNSYADIIGTYPKTRVTIVGQGSWKNQVKEFCTKYKNAHYYDFVENRHLPQLLNQHSIYVLPARETKKFGLKIGAEQFGFSIVEAMSCGLCVIASDVGALPEVITSMNPVYNKNKPAQLTKILTNLLSDPKKVTQIGYENETIVEEKYNLKSQAIKFQHTLQYTIEAKNSRQG